MIKTLFRMILMAMFAVWFGGFTFYTAFVVPTGTHILESSRIQGFITQEVTNWLNFVGWFALAMFMIELIIERKNRSKAKTIFIVCLIAFLVSFSGVLSYVHSVLDANIVISEEGVFENDVLDVPQFYQIHRVYLWVSTFQWIGCWIWLFATMQDWNREKSE